MKIGHISYLIKRINKDLPVLPAGGPCGAFCMPSSNPGVISKQNNFNYDGLCPVVAKNLMTGTMRHRAFSVLIRGKMHRLATNPEGHSALKAFSVENAFLFHKMKKALDLSSPIHICFLIRNTDETYNRFI